MGDQNDSFCRVHGFGVLGDRPVAKGFGPVGRPRKFGQVHFLMSTYLSVSEFFLLSNEQFGNLILRQIIKFVANICQILRLKYTKLKFGWGSAPDPAGELTVLPETT